MADEENNFQPSKKRAAGVQLSRENPGLDDDEDTSEQETGTFKRAADEVLANRRIVKVRRQPTPSVPAPAPASNPFAAIHLVAPAASASPVGVEASSVTSKEAEQIEKNDEKSENAEEAKGQSTADEEKIDVNAKQIESKVDESKTVSEEKTTESVVDKLAEDDISQDGARKSTEADNSQTEARKDVEGEGEKGNVEENSETEAWKDLGAEGNDEEKGDAEKTTEKNAETTSFSSFHQLSSGQNAFSGLAGTGFSSASFSFGSIPKDGSALGSSTGSLFGLKNNGNSSLFGSSGASTASKTEGSSSSSKFPSMNEVPLETGEENEKAVFTADSVLFEYIDGSWKERGKGELKVNVSTTGTGKSRLVMRTKGNYRLILNASLFPDMKLTNMDKKGITFACINSAAEGKDGLSTIALKFRDPSIVEEFRAAVMEHKSKAPVALKTPENSPKASDE